LTQVPVTIDYRILERAIQDLDVNLLEDGTAIGTALATAANRLRRTPGSSKVV
ncbi:MAG: aerotolerance regulator BatA, partial [Gemmatimonadetes bacterium]|nr:aerotolerance regulator BatA [Gemmatimonadota bacterium]